MRRWMIGLVGIVLVLSTGICQASKISEVLEKELGQLVGRNLERELGGISNDPEMNARVRNLGVQLTQVTNVAYDIRVLNSGQVNAFSVPGHIIYFTTGMLRSVSPDDEVAFVLGHEATHDENKDSIKQLGASVALGMVLGKEDLAKKVLKLLLVSGRSRECERVADTGGVAKMKAMGCDPSGALGMMRRLETIKESNPSLVSTLFATHDPASERAEKMKDAMLIAALGSDYHNALDVKPLGPLTSAPAEEPAGIESSEVSRPSSASTPSLSEPPMTIEDNGAVVAGSSSWLWPVEYIGQTFKECLSSLNCGPTSSVMACCFARGSKPSIQQIKDFNKAINVGECGELMGFSKLIKGCLKYYGIKVAAKGLSTKKDPDENRQWIIEQLRREIRKGPVIVAVISSQLPNRGYRYASKHILLAIGYDDGSIICHDPVTAKYGVMIHYRNRDFVDSMKPQGYAVITGFAKAGDQPTEKPKPKLGRSKILLAQGPVHLGDDAKNAKMVWFNEFLLTAEDLTGKSRAKITVEVKAIPRKDPCISINRKQIGWAVAKGRDWEYFEFSFSTKLLRPGKNLVDLETIIVSLHNTYDDCDFRNLYLVFE